MTKDTPVPPPDEERRVPHPIRGELGSLHRDGHVYARWQHKPTLRADARIWFSVEDDVVYLEQVHTHHPHETK
ncbi:hypothetical protein F8O03_13240 [Pseudoclavibacter terrae]|uniref:Uncharacterized protein n=1 Tax=Pseudoclavibacter terrae TaxID=1530195 RepID=A0A7J5B081_9MICO|nr:hypothetical protein F8O03_13240 [Pseudoclavibacter terrae]